MLGSNEQGQAGVEPKHGQKRFNNPLKIPLSKLGEEVQVEMLDCGYSHVLAVTRSRKLYAWGANDCGQLGNGRREPVFEPKLVDAFKGVVIEFCACGDEYSAVVNEAGELFTFGANSKGRLGIGLLDENGNQLIPRKVELPGFPHIKSICCGMNHVLAIPDYDSEDAKADKGVWSWGLSTRGQLGHGNREPLNAPKLIQKLAGERFKKVCCGFEHSMGLTEDNRLYFWGDQRYYLRSEFSSGEDKEEPVIMQASDKVTDIAASHAYNLAICEGLNVIYWGSLFKDVSHAKSTDAGTKGIVIESKLKVKAKQIACGPNHAAAVGLDGALYTWGYDSDGSLGLNKEKSKNQVRMPEMVKKITTAINKGRKDIEEVKREVGLEMDAVAADPDEKGETKKEEEKKAENAEMAEIAQPKGAAEGTQVVAAAKLPEMEKLIDLQKKIKDNEHHLTQKGLIREQKDISKSFEVMLSKFKSAHNMALQNRHGERTFAINLISGLENGPFKMKRRMHLLCRYPATIRKNKVQLKEIFQALYTHPCYLFNLFDRGLADQALLSSFITSLYGSSCDRKYTRVLLMNLGILVFKKEVGQGDATSFFK